MGLRGGLTPLVRGLCAEGCWCWVLLLYLHMWACSGSVLFQLVVAWVACWGALQNPFMGCSPRLRGWSWPHEELRDPRERSCSPVSPWLWGCALRCCCAQEPLRRAPGSNEAVLAGSTPVSPSSEPARTGLLPPRAPPSIAPGSALSSVGSLWSPCLARGSCWALLRGSPAATGSLLPIPVPGLVPNQLFFPLAQLPGHFSRLAPTQGSP